MIAKKNPKADLEKKRFAFFQIGLLVAGSLTLAAFEYSSAHLEQTKVASINDVPGIYAEPAPQDPFQQPEQPQKKKQIALIIDDVKVVDKILPDNSAIVADKGSEIIDFGDDDGDDGDEYVFATVEPEKIIDFPDIVPSFPGGESAMIKFIRNNIQLPDYIPPYDSGTLYVQFVVNKDGSIEQVDVVKGLSFELDNSAQKVVKSMPRWKAGEQAGKPVRVRFTLPIQIGSN